MNESTSIVFAMAHAITARLNETPEDISARKEDNDLKWGAAFNDAEAYMKKYGRQEQVLSLYSVMQLQNRRAAGELHLTSGAARALLQEEVDKAVRAEAEPVVQDSLRVLLSLQEHLLNLTRTNMSIYLVKYQADYNRRFLSNPVPREIQHLLMTLTHALERLLFKSEELDELAGAGEKPVLDDVTEALCAEAKAAARTYLGLEAEAEQAPEKVRPHTAEAYFKQRAETLLNQLRKAGAIPKHTQLLNFMAITEGFKNFQALKAKLTTDKPNFCPHCGAAGQLEECGTVFCEMGKYDGCAYEAEGDAPQYQCSRCNRRFTDWRDWADAEGETAQNDVPEEANPMRVTMLRLESHYGMDGQHPRYDRECWDEEVRVRDTRLTNYWEWLVHQLEANQEMFPWERDNSEDVQLCLAAGLKVQPAASGSWDVVSSENHDGLFAAITGKDSEAVAWIVAAQEVLEHVFEAQSLEVATVWITMPLHRKLEIVREVFGQPE